MWRLARGLGILCLIMVLACGVGAGPADDGTGDAPPSGSSYNDPESPSDVQPSPEEAGEPTHEKSTPDMPVDEGPTPDVPVDEDQSQDEALPADIEATLIACWAAYNARDWDLYLSYCTGYADPQVFLLQSQVAREMSGEVTIDSISDIQIKGTTATAVVTLSSKQGTRSAPRTLRNEDGWKVVASPAE